MVNSLYKSKAKELIAKAEKKKLIKTYSEFCETSIGKDSSLSENEVNYYTSNCKGENNHNEKI